MNLKKLYFFIHLTDIGLYMREREREHCILYSDWFVSFIGVIDQGYFDVMAEYSKHTPNDVLAKYTVTNRGKERATVHVLPTLWFRNVWSWGEDAYVSPTVICRSMGNQLTYWSQEIQ